MNNKNEYKFKNHVVNVLYQHDFFRTTEYKLTTGYLEITDLRSNKLNKSKIPLENINPQESIKSSMSKSAILALCLLPILLTGLTFNLFHIEFQLQNIIPLILFAVIGTSCVFYLVTTKNLQYIFTDGITQDVLFTLQTEKDKLHKLNSFVFALKDNIRQKQAPSTFDKFAVAALKNKKDIEIIDQPLYHLEELQNLGVLDDYLYNRIKNNITEIISENDRIINQGNIISFSAIKK